MPEELKDMNEDAADGGADEDAEGEGGEGSKPDTSGLDEKQIEETKAALRASRYAKRKLIKVEFQD
jgi:hypothetical protein